MILLYIRNSHTNMKPLLVITAMLLASCRSQPTPADYFDLWFVTPKNPFPNENNP